MASDTTRVQSWLTTPTPLTRQEKQDALLWELVRNDSAASMKELFFYPQMRIKARNIKDPLGNTLLHEAAELGHYEIAEMLMEKALIEPNVTNDYDDTPLHGAAK